MRGNGEMSKVVFIKVLIGVSGSGKSTYARELAKDYNEEICSTDKYVIAHAESRLNEDGVKLSYDQAFDDIQKNDLFKVITGRFYNDIEKNIKNGNNFIIDRTNLSARARASLIKELRELGKKYGKAVVIYGIVFNPPISVIHDRLKKRIILENKKIPADVLDDQIKNLQLPTDKEDFDVLKNNPEIYGHRYILGGM